jgi:hypothetical protein
MESVMDLIKSASESIRSAQNALAEIESKDEATSHQAEAIKALVESCATAQAQILQKQSALVGLLMEMAVATVGVKEYNVPVCTRFKTTTEGHLLEWHSGGGVASPRYDRIEFAEFIRTNSESINDRLPRCWAFCELMLKDIQTFLSSKPADVAKNSALVQELQEKIQKLILPPA